MNREWDGSLSGKVVRLIIHWCWLKSHFSSSLSQQIGQETVCVNPNPGTNIPVSVPIWKHGYLYWVSHRLSVSSAPGPHWPFQPSLFFWTLSLKHWEPRLVSHDICLLNCLISLHLLARWVWELLTLPPLGKPSLARVEPCHADLATSLADVIHTHSYFDQHLLPHKLERLFHAC